MLENIPVEIYISIGLLIINLILLMINISAVKNSKKQLEANDAPRILIQGKREKTEPNYAQVDIINVGNGLAIDAFCILSKIEENGKNIYLLSKPSREVFPLGEYTFYFSLENKDIDIWDMLENPNIYETKVVYKDFFGQYYQAGYNLPEGTEPTHLEQFADESKQLKKHEIRNVEKQMRMAVQQKNHYTINDVRHLKKLELDLKQKNRKYNKYSE